MDWRHTLPDSEKRRLLKRLKERKQAAIEDLNEPLDEEVPEAKQRLNWPEEHAVDQFGLPSPFHIGQKHAWDSVRRFVAMIAGTQGGKTKFGPWWLKREIERMGGGTYLAVTSTFPLFNNAMLPAMQEVFVTILGIGKYWGNTRVIEIADPVTGKFWAKKSSDEMYARILLRSADKGGLEAVTAKAAWLDEAGQSEFTVQTWRAVRRRLQIFRGRALLTSTLYDLGWLVQQIINRAEGGAVDYQQMENGAEVTYTDNKKTDIGLVQYDSIANPAFPIEEFLEAQEEVPDDEFQMFWKGKAAGYRYLIYDEFVQNKKLMTRKRFKIPRHWERYMGIDFGGVNTAAIFYAEEPDTGRLYAYREYHEGKKTIREHVEDLKEGEPGIPYAVGGAGSEDQWRDEFTDHGLPVSAPDITSVDVGINRVYACHKKREIIYFDDLEIVLDQKGKYRRKRDRAGDITDEIHDKRKFHMLDAERYIISDIRGEAKADPGDFEDMGTVDDVDNPWL